MKNLGEKKFDIVLEQLTDDLLAKSVDEIEKENSDNSSELDIDEIESDHTEFNEKITKLEDTQSELILICSALIVLLYDKNIVDRNAMRQLLVDTDRMQSDGIESSGSMEYLRNLLSGKTVPSVHDVSPDGPSYDEKS